MLLASSSFGLPQADLDHVQHGVGSAWLALRGQHLLLTGGTGFVGKWLLASLLHADRALGLGLRVTVLTRDAARFTAQHPALALASPVTLLQGDVRSFVLPAVQHISHVIHAATDVVAPHSLAETFDTCVRGTQQVLQQAQRAGAQRLLLLSSGAVYGAAPPGQQRLAEDHAGAPDCLQPASAYGEGKRAAELLCALAAATHGLQIPVARCFAFVGPHLPLDKHFAIGNFIGAALRDEPLLIQGNGTPLRSYLHAADLALWLWTLLLKGQSGTAYNVGGDEAVSIAALAQRVCAVLGSSSSVTVAKSAVPGAPVQRYLPDLGRMAQQFGLRPHITLDQAILRTADWARQSTTPLHKHTPEHSPC